ncbi:MAG TPA: hypothetical protein VK447_21495 [Myxococcaceae bacterium]|nr:hypothetical protein [Myxococcaceae bacterium]
MKEISSEERLERELSATPSREEINEGALKQLSCQQTPEDLAQARNENRPESDRLMAYVELFESLKKKLATFEEAMTRNPDLHYQEKNQDIVAARDLCIQQVADVRVEFETYLRELVNVPTVQEIKGGSTITVARLDFSTLRQAIETLNPDDKEALHNRVNSAEKKVGPAPASETAPATTGSGGKRRGK